MTGLQGSSSYTIDIRTRLAQDNGSRNASTLVVASDNYSFGTGTGQANEVYSDTVTISASGNTTITLRGGSEENPLGEACSFQTIKEILVYLDPDTTNQAISVEIGNATTPWVGPFSAGTATQECLKGGVWRQGGAKTVGWSVGAGQGLKIVNNDGTNAAVVNIVVVGVKV